MARNLGGRERDREIELQKVILATKGEESHSYFILGPSTRQQQFRLNYRFAYIARM